MEHTITLKLDDNQVAFDNTEVNLTSGQGLHLAYDDWCGRWFRSSVQAIESAVNRINQRLILEGEVSLNDFYDEIGLSPVGVGEIFGWSGGPLIELMFSAMLSDEGTPVIVASFREEPKPHMGMR